MQKMAKDLAIDLQITSQLSCGTTIILMFPKVQYPVRRFDDATADSYANTKENKPAASLIISWLIILGVYLLLRLVFVIFGFHLAPVVLGGCLAVLPYIAGAFYLFNTPAAHRVGGCVLGILLPSIVENSFFIFWCVPLRNTSGRCQRSNEQNCSE